MEQQPQLIMRWTYDGSEKPELNLPDGFTVTTLPKLSDGVEKWLDLMQFGLSEKREDYEFYLNLMPRFNKNYDENKCFFIMNGERAVATITVICDDETKEGYIHMVACHPDMRGRGLGGALNRIAVGELIDSGMKTAHLTTDDWRIPAIKSYLKIGFVPDESTDNFKERWDKIFSSL